MAQSKSRGAKAAQNVKIGPAAEALVNLVREGRIEDNPLTAESLEWVGDARAYRNARLGMRIAGTRGEDGHETITCAFSGRTFRVKVGRVVPCLFYERWVDDAETKEETEHLDMHPDLLKHGPEGFEEEVILFAISSMLDDAWFYLHQAAGLASIVGKDVPVAWPDLWKTNGQEVQS